QLYPPQVFPHLPAAWIAQQANLYHVFHCRIDSWAQLIVVSISSKYYLAYAPATQRCAGQAVYFQRIIFYSPFYLQSFYLCSTEHYCHFPVSSSVLSFWN